MTPLALYDDRGSAAVITINRPDKRNTLSRALIVALTEAFERAKSDPKTRCVLLTGAGSAFCAGMDLAEVMAALQRLPEEQREVLVLVCVEEFSYRDAADVLSIPIGTVMSRLARARKNLMELTGISFGEGRSPDRKGGVL